MWFLLAACTDGGDEAQKEGECPSLCEVDIALELPETTEDDRLVVRSDPAGSALSAEVTDPDGEILGGGSAVGELEIDLSGALEEGVEYTVTVGWACTPGEAQPLCEEDRWTFEVSPPPVAHIEDVLVRSAPQLDLLWVVDNSCSMGDEQSDLAQSFPLFINYVVGSGIDYHVGVTSTDLDGTYNGSKGKLRVANGIRWIDPSTPDPEQVFEAMVMMGTAGSSSEKGLGATFVALEQQTEPGGPNEGFLRPDSDLHVVIVSDEPDQTPPTIVTPDECIDWFNGLRPPGADARFHAIAHPVYGERYLQVQQGVGGTVWNIETDGWQNFMEGIGGDLDDEAFCLSQPPEVSSITVSVIDPSGNELPFEEGTDWIYDATSNCISFLEYIPSVGAEIHIRYLPAS